MEVDPEDECEVIEDIDVNMNSKGEYVEFMEEETAEEIKNEEVKMEEPFHVNTKEEVGSLTLMDVNEGIKPNVKDIKVEDGEENVTAGPSGEYIEEDQAESKFVRPAKKPKIVSVEESCETDSEEEGNKEREGEDSDSDSMTPERYERQAKMDALYKEQLGLTIEDDDDEEEREVGFYLYICSFSSISWIFQVEEIHDMIINNDCVPEEKLFLIKYVRQLYLTSNFFGKPLSTFP